MSKLTVLAFCAVIAGVLAEPPSSYLPPQARASPSSTYGAPNGGFNGGSNGGFGSNGKASSFHSQRTGSKSFSYNSLHENQFGGSKKSFGGFGAPSQQYGAPSQSYGAPSRNGNGHNGNGNGNGFGLSQQYGASRNGFGGSSNGLSQKYGAPRNGFGGSSNGFGAPSQSYGAPSQSYGAPSQSYGAPSQSYGAPSKNGNGHNGNGHNGNGFGLSQQYGAPRNGFGGSSNGLSQQYGAPAASSNGFGVSQQYGAPSFGGSSNGFGLSQQYGAPSFGSSSSSSYKSFNGNGNGKSKGAPSPVYGAPSGYGYNRRMDDDLAEPANYEYTYEVQAAEESGAEFGHQESREDESARGVYHVLLPDGRTQIVEYEADEEGFRPVIRYEEPTGYPEARGPQGPY